MTNRENFLSLLRRTGYESVPVEFSLCPYLIERMRNELGVEDYQEYFQFPWRRVGDIRLIDHDVSIHCLPSCFSSFGLHNVYIRHPVM